MNSGSPWRPDARLPLGETLEPRLFLSALQSDLSPAPGASTLLLDCRVSGTIRDAAGAPQAGIRVLLLGNNNVLETQTNGAGRYEFTGVASGTRYTVAPCKAESGLAVDNSLVSGEAIMDIARSQIGNTDGPSPGIYHGHDGGWCSEFASWAYWQAGEPFTGGADDGGDCDLDWNMSTTDRVLAAFGRKDNWQYLSINEIAANWPALQDQLEPQAGDFVIYSNTTGIDRAHSGLVESISGTTMYTVEGNVSNLVKRVTRSNWLTYQDGNTVVKGIGYRRLVTPVDFSPAYHQEYLRSDLSVDFTLFRKTDVQVSISCDDPTPLEGQTVTYSLRAVNNGPGPASGLGLNVPLPAGLSYVSSSDPAAYDAPGGQWDIGALAPGAVATLELTARPNPGTGGQVITTSLQVAHVNESDTDSGNDRRWATVTVVNVNDPPTEILFSAASVAENRPAGAWAGSFDTIDLDSGDTFTYSLVAGPGDDHNALFTIEADRLETAGPLNFEDGSPVHVRVRSTDHDGLWIESMVLVSVTDRNDPPVADGLQLVVHEDGMCLGVASGQDEDGDDLRFSLWQAPGHGTVLLQPGGSFSYRPASNYNGLDSFLIRAHDGLAASAPAVIDVTIQPVNDAPSFTGGGNQSSLPDGILRTVAGWATAISPGPADEAGQGLVFELVNDNNGLFATQPYLAEDGTLTYAPAVGALGSAVVQVVLRDDGGTANGGTDRSLQTFIIAVGHCVPLPGNSAYSFRDGGQNTVTVRLVGPGGGMLLFPSQNSDLARIVLTGTSDRSMLMITGRTSVGGIECAGPLMRIAASTVDISGPVTIGPASSATATTMLMLGRVSDADIQSQMPISTFTASQWLDTDATPDALTAPWATTVIVRGDMGADVTLNGANQAGKSVNTLNVMGSLDGANLAFAGAAGSIMARSWTTGSLTADLVNTIMIRGNMGADVTLTEENTAGNSVTMLSVTGTVSSATINLLGGAGTVMAGSWAAAQFTAETAGTFMSRGGFGGNMTLTGRGRTGSSVNVFRVLGEMVGGLLRTDGGVGTAMIGSMRDSGLYVSVLDGVAGMPLPGATAAEYFAAAAGYVPGGQPDRSWPAIRTLTISQPVGMFQNSVVAAPSIGTVVLRGVVTNNPAGTPFGLVVDDKITTLTRYRAGAPLSVGRNLNADLVDVLPAEGDFGVAVL